MRKRLLFSLTLLLAMVTAAKAEDMKTVPLTVESVTGGWVYFTNKSDGIVTYRLNDEEVKTIESKKAASIEVEEGDKISFWGDNEKYGAFYENQSSMIEVDEEESIYVYGNIMSLVSSTDFASATTLTQDYAFANMFHCDNYSGYILSHPTKELVLPATTLTRYCYYSMFYACDITTAPALPATTLADFCYMEMFKRCYKLTATPDLPATKLAQECYAMMFQGCTSLITAPSVLPATTLAKECYSNMFAGCTSLTTAPKLPATKLDRWCYNSMFNGCTSLAEAPELKATELKSDCYEGMFAGCTSLTTAPTLPATELEEGCYSNMFAGCTGLTAAPELPATEMKAECYQGMFGGCTSLTTPPELPATKLAWYCYESMFEDCTSLTTAPALPAMTLAESCYESMFSGCTSLTTAPVLPAPKLVESCYEYMFKYCENLNAVTCLASSINVYLSTAGWLVGTSETGTFTKAATISWETGEEGIPEGWTVQETSDMKLATAEIDEDQEEPYPYWTTYYHSAASYEAAPGTTVYTAALDGTNLIFTEVADRIVRAGQAVIMASDNPFITMTPTTASGTDSYYAGNMLKGSDSEVTMKKKTTYFALANLDYGLGFYKINPDGVESIPAHKAYIELSGAGARFLDFVYGEGPAAIASMQDDSRNKAGETVYDLQGRRVKNPVSGLYIVNGKKTIVK